LFGDAAEIRVQRIPRGFVAQERPAIFGGENQMNVNGGKGLWHVGRMVRRVVVCQSQRDCVLQPKVGAPAPTLGVWNRKQLQRRWVTNQTNRTTSTRLWPFVREWESPQPHCGWDVCWTMTQGSALRATLGFGTESRWDSRRVEFESPRLSSNGAKSISTFVFPGGADLLLQRLIPKLKQRLRRRFVRRPCDVSHNPVGVVISFRCFPRVARSSQPWALGQNPVGIPRWRAAERRGVEGVAALSGGGARGVAGRGDQRSAAARPDSAVGLLGATGTGAARKGRRRVKVLRDAGRQLRTFNRA